MKHLGLCFFFCISELKEPILKIEKKAELITKGFEIFDYVDEETKDTVLMQHYFIAFLNRGPNRLHNKTTSDSLQALLMATHGTFR